MVPCRARIPSTAMHKYEQRMGAAACRTAVQLDVLARRVAAICYPSARSHDAGRKNGREKERCKGAK